MQYLDLPIPPIPKLTKGLLIRLFRWGGLVLNVLISVEPKPQSLGNWIGGVGNKIDIYKPKHLEHRVYKEVNHKWYGWDRLLLILLKKGG